MDLTIIEHLTNIFDAVIEKCLEFGKCVFLEKVPSYAFNYLNNSIAG